MTGNYFCERLESLAAIFSGDQTTRNENMDTYVQHCIVMKPANLTELKRQLICVIRGLALVDTRLADLAPLKQ
jgi:hypothetical protein